MANFEDIERAKQGEDVWNKWAEDNKGAKVDFSDEMLNIDFSGFTFPGLTKFDRTEFTAKANFSGARFTDAVSFTDARFNRSAGFENVQFMRAANFDRANFAEYSTFESAQFLYHAYFNETEFNGYTFFRWAKFKGSAFFEGAQFPDYTDFMLVQFSGYVRFRLCQFGDEAYFVQAKFDEDASFRNSKIFRPDFSEANFTQTPDFVGADIKTSFQGVNFDFIDDKNANYAELLRRLKSLAAAEKDHEMEMKFFAQEMRAKRRSEISSRTEKFWNYLYELFSFYGTSIARPAICLVMTFVVFFGLYLSIPSYRYCESKTSMLSYLAYSNLIPIPTGLKSSQIEITSCLFGNHIPASMMFLTSLEGIVGAVFLFLFLLAIRNKFKIK